MRTKARIVVTAGVILILFLGWRAIKNIRFLAPAPKGIHGVYAPAFDVVLKTTSNNPGGFFSMLHNEIRVEPHDRYRIGGIPCANQKIEAYVEFDSKQTAQIEMKILWINALPSDDDAAYESLTREYYRCLESFLLEQNLIEDHDSIY